MAMHLRPIERKISIMAVKACELNLHVDHRGRPVLTVWTSAGEFAATGPPLALDRWQPLDAELFADRLTLEVNRVGESVPVSGAPTDGASNLEVGHGFVGHIDAFQLAGFRDASKTLAVVGADEDGVIELDAHGRSTVTLAPAGDQTTPGIHRYRIIAVPVASSTPAPR